MTEQKNPFASQIYRKISRLVGTAIEKYNLINEKPSKRFSSEF